MGPIMIADSDEESDSNEQIVAPSPVTVPQAQTRSSEQGSLATASTDSALFQQIFNEQNAAACERALQLQLQQELEDAPHQSSAMTIPDVPFQRTTKGFYHSSLTSVTDPRSEMSRNFPAMRSSERTLERTQERTQSAVDPWEVPSSPGAPNLQEEQAKDQGEDAPDQSYGGDKSPLGADTPLENRWDDLERMEGRDKKRRRLDESEAALSQSNDVDLVMSPHESKLISTNDELETAAASSTSLPAIPIGDTNSAFQNNSSIVKSVPGDAVNGASSAIPRYNNLLLKQQTQYAVGSSGSATNINTPRNQMFSIPSFGSKDPEEQESTTTTKKIEYRNFISRRGSSPDIISAPAPDLDEVAPEPRYSPDLNPEPKVDQEYHDDRDHLADQPPLPEELPPEELPPEGSDAEFVARPTPAAKSKKKRGRPKKSLETDEPPPVKLAESPAPATDAISPVPTTQKKKRGRPKKQSDEPAVESALLAAATPTPAVRGEKKTGGKKKVTKGRKKLVVLSDSEGDHSATEDLAAEEPREQDAVEETLKPEATEDDQKRAASGKKSKAKASLDDQTILDDKSEDEDEPKEIKKHSTLEKEERSGDKKGLSALGLAKPIYRVGLSKRSRIAPLLKSVRKA